MSQSYKVKILESVTAAAWMLRSIFESMQEERDILIRPWINMSCEYYGNPSDNGISQRYVKFAFVFRDSLRTRHAVCASGMVYRNSEGEWYRGEFEVALWGTVLPKSYHCKLVHGWQYEILEGTIA
ncbi:MAG: hypothetical protein AAB652_02665 [Patescibacteria group bacterium]